MKSDSRTVCLQPSSSGSSPVCTECAIFCVCEMASRGHLRESPASAAAGGDDSSSCFLSPVALLFTVALSSLSCLSFFQSFVGLVWLGSSFLPSLPPLH